MPSHTDTSQLDKKYIIIGNIYFYDDRADIKAINIEQMCYSNNELDRLLAIAEDDGLDYIVLPDYTKPIMTSSAAALNKINRIITMSTDIGWGDRSF